MLTRPWLSKGLNRFVLVVVILGLAGGQVFARRVILMIGDGMGFKHVEITRNYLGVPLAMESLPTKYACTTYEYGGSYSTSLAWSNFNYV
ncbi:MAG: hypothetical protein QHI38_10940, partial [Armatimonadota bacterium]|nr:hypothetical protein [Armatimonadota bacterium]